MEHETSLVPNWTLFIQMAIFLASWVTLHFLVFRPYLALIIRRHEKGAGLKEKAASMTERAKALRDQYEIRLKEIRNRISLWVEGERKKIAEEEKGVIQKARDAASSDILASRNAMNVAVGNARKELLPKIEEYSSQIVSKLVGYHVDVPKKFAESAKFEETHPTV